jgi:hypothetical protein
VTFSNPLQVPSLVTLSSNKMSFSADGIDKIIFTITATDSSGAPVPGQTCNIYPYSAFSIPLGGSGDNYTNASGQGITSMHSGGPQTGTIAPAVMSVTAVVSGVNSNVVSITATPPL